MTTSSSSDVMEIVPGVVFLSHASQDSDMAVEIHRLLKHEGVPVWMAAQEIKPGANYADTIFKTLTLSKAVIVILTKNSIASEHVRREVNIAIDKKIKLFPVNLSGVDDIVPILPAAWKYWLSITQILTCKDAQTAANTLLGLIGKEGEELEFVRDTPSAVVDSDDIPRALERLRAMFDEVFLITQDQSAMGNFSVIDFNRTFDAEVKPGLEWLLDHRSVMEDAADETAVVIARAIGQKLFTLFSMLCEISDSDFDNCFTLYLETSAFKCTYRPAILKYLEYGLAWNFEQFFEMQAFLLNEGFFLGPVQVALEFAEIHAPTPLGARERDMLFLILYFTDILTASWLKYVGEIFHVEDEPLDYNEILVRLESLKIELKKGGIDELIQHSGSEKLLLWYNAIQVLSAFIYRKLNQEQQVSDVLKSISDADKENLQEYWRARLVAASGMGKLIYMEFIQISEI